jgi:leucyl-tRNA synthetase
MASDERIELVVQVNGKVRGKLNVTREISQDDAVGLAMKEESIWKFVSGEPRKIIFVPGRLLNIVG